MQELSPRNKAVPRMKTPWPTAFVVGPPAAGKTTIGTAVAARMNGVFRTIDDWTPRGTPVTDAQIEETLSLLFESTAPMNEIVEFAHHNYRQLLNGNTFPIFTNARKIIVTAPLDLCKARNRLRTSPVRDAYIERAWQSTQSLVDSSSTEHPNNAMVVDTSSQSVDAAVVAATLFLITGG
jgi:hypothetical protein